MFLALTVAYVVCQAYTTLDRRLIQAVRSGLLPPSEPMLPKSVGLLYYAQWAVGLGLLVLDWKRALVVFGVVFVLQVLPVMETLGNVLAVPLRRWGRPYGRDVL